MAVINMLPTNNGAGARVETRLYQNQSPTTQMTQKILLTLTPVGFESYNYYKFIYFDNVSQTKTYTAYVSSKEMKTSGQRLALSGTTSGEYIRPVRFSTQETGEVSVIAERSRKYTDGTEDATTMIPYEIYGITGELVPITKFEDVLWENADPTTSFAGQQVTLSNSLANYDMLRIYYDWSTNSGVMNSTKYNDFALVDIDQYILNSYNHDYRFVWGITNSSNNYVRTARLIDTNYDKLQISNAFRLNAQGNNNVLAIPLKICGIKIA